MGGGVGMGVGWREGGREGMFVVEGAVCARTANIS